MRYSAPCAELTFRSEDLGVFNFCVGRSAFDVLRSEAAARPPPVKQTLAPPGASQVWRKIWNAAASGIPRDAAF
jgi:hypothetical protein